MSSPSYKKPKHCGKYMKWSPGAVTPKDGYYRQKYVCKVCGESRLVNTGKVPKNG